MSVATDYKPWFDEKCPQFSDQTKHVKWQWLQDPNHSDTDNLNNVSCEASGHCGAGEGARWEWLVNAMSWPLYPWGKKLVSIVREARWAPGPLSTGAENLSPTGIRSLNCPAIATRYTSPPNTVRKRITGELYRGINKFKKGHQPRTYIVKFEKSDLFADSHNILKR